MKVNYLVSWKPISELAYTYEVEAEDPDYAEQYALDMHIENVGYDKSKDWVVTKVWEKVKER
jgi:hypothetical protein